MSYDDYYYDDPLEQFYSPEQLALMSFMTPQGDASTYDLDPNTYGMFANTVMPQMDTKGRIQPFDLGVQSQGTNFMQDVYGSTLMNPMFAYMAEAGGGGGYAPGAFDPVYEQTPLQLTATPGLAYTRQTGGVQGLLAGLLMGGPDEDGNYQPPMNPNQAAARVRAMIEKPDSFGLDENERADLESQLPALTDQFGASQGPDWNSLSKLATDMYTPLVQEQAMIQQPNVRQLPDGSYVTVEQKDSPQTEFLKKMGLPDPNARYDLNYAMETNPALMGLLTRVASTQAERADQRKEFEKTLKDINKTRETMRANEQALQKWREASGRSVQQYLNTPQQFRGEVEAEKFAPRGQMPQSWYAGKSQQEIAQPEYIGFQNPELEMPERPKLGWTGDVPKTWGEMMRGDWLASPARNEAATLIPDRIRRIQQTAREGQQNRAINNDLFAYMRAIAPTIRAGRAGRTPAGDVMQARLAPLRSAGLLPY